MSKHIYSLLCLGDSYTIGEGLPLHLGFPYQLVQLLRKKHIPFHAPEIVAKTGWTSFELADHLIHHSLLDHYDFVTLLIGVNNQYRDLPLSDYSEEFDFLLRKAIHLAQNKPGRVVVISIPDWGVTPFAFDRKRQAIADAIDQFNEVNETLALKYGAHYVNITPGSKAAAGDSSLLAADGLHYSAAEYARWASEVFAIVSAAAG
jgi:lysophospholipase L1-like esterase